MDFIKGNKMLTLKNSPSYVETKKLPHLFLTVKIMPSPVIFWDVTDFLWFLWKTIVFVTQSNLTWKLQSMVSNDFTLISR